MLYIVTLSYRGAAAEREKHSAGHKSWLVEHIKTGEVVLAGPLENQQGGVVLFLASDEQAVRDRLTEDPLWRWDWLMWLLRAFIQPWFLLCLTPTGAVKRRSLIWPTAPEAVCRGAGHRSAASRSE